MSSNKNEGTIPSGFSLLDLLEDLHPYETLNSSKDLWMKQRREKWFSYIEKGKKIERLERLQD